MSSPDPIRRVAIVFSGGPAPAANAVISTCAASFLRNNINVVGIRNGFSGLVDFSPYHPMEVGRDFIIIDSKILRRTRNSQGIMIGTARTNPGGLVSHPSHLDDAERVPLIEVELISIFIPIHKFLVQRGVEHGQFGARE